jgi:hypothetical protein
MKVVHVVIADEPLLSPSDDIARLTCIHVSRIAEIVLG